MEIITRFNINDEVWFIHPVSQQCVSGKVIEILSKTKAKKKYKHGVKRDLIFTGEYEPQKFVPIYYLTDRITGKRHLKYETQVFSTKEELINSLSEKS